ncbi:MAG: DUF4013 domain-containing protein [Nanoarchaeota archaeon]
MVDYSKAFGRPFTDWKNLLIGIVISAIPIVCLISYGYILKSTVKNPTGNLPAWDDFGDLFTKGLLAAVISFLYILPALIILMILGLPLIIGIMRGNLTDIVGGAVGLGFGILIALLVLSIAYYFIPAALLNYAAKGKFNAAFDFNAINKKVFTGKYALAWTIGVVYSVLLISILNVIPYIGIIIGGFIGSVTMYSLIGQAIKTK